MTISAPLLFFMKRVGRAAGNTLMFLFIMNLHPVMFNRDILWHLVVCKISFNLDTLPVSGIKEGSVKVGSRSLPSHVLGYYISLFQLLLVRMLEVGDPGLDGEHAYDGLPQAECVRVVEHVVYCDSGQRDVPECC